LIDQSDADSSISDTEDDSGSNNEQSNINNVGNNNKPDTADPTVASPKGESFIYKCQKF